ncbi:MAG: hypothetical protein HYR96_15050 [Deltaproteobacteria bacterium]|nr:hypothetical protein [Deltaproteobacteria bacterium]MBI3293704.1 hypothetical protein [Deltaproteobacteria bacterium]
MEITVASVGDIDDLLRLVRETSTWLETKGIKQWTTFARNILEQETKDKTLYAIKVDEAIIGSLVILARKKNATWDDKGALYVDRLVI